MKPTEVRGRFCPSQKRSLRRPNIVTFKRGFHLVYTDSRQWTALDALDILREQLTISNDAAFERVSGGIEFEVFRVSARGRDPFIIKFPGTRWIINDNDRDLDSFQLMDQERRLIGFSHEHGIPAPRVLAYPEAGSFPVLAMEIIDADDLPLLAGELGRMTRRLHLLRPPEISTVAQRGRSPSDVVAQLTVERLKVVEQLSGVGGAVPTESTLREMLGPIDADVRLLHMDLRRGNYLSRDGQITGLIDWSNAMIANPVLELARLVEYGEFSNGFAAGYEITQREAATLSGEAGLACSLYTAAMLAVVFLSEAPDPELAAIKVERVKELLTQFG
ncbi:aminoglycoside phosphotransferase family protein [Sinorhizobium meliloti]|nr:aminoglycoside phosphotransferase family protein [Sinorhizobium meliloti]RVH47465.1 aminoglycoside phosphotransferase family protein [Sinorhizobium meliloti]RVK11103.1 aminoglycoside phosphotransferase family protein [Sinorhizobium meliloti]